MDPLAAVLSGLKVVVLSRAPRRVDGTGQHGDGGTLGAAEALTGIDRVVGLGRGEWE
jgi:hypothetical protein